MEPNPKWEAKVSTKLTNTSADQIWPLIKDFFNMHKYFPTLATSHGVHGTNGEVGCVRYCSGSSLPPKDKNVISDTISWSKEKLVAIDHVERSLCYEIVNSNIGFESYKSTFKIVPDGDGCVVDWFFSVDPIQGLRFEDLVVKYEVGLQRMGKTMKDALVGGDNNNNNNNVD